MSMNKLLIKKKTEQGMATCGERWCARRATKIVGNLTGRPWREKWRRTSKKSEGGVQKRVRRAIDNVARDRGRLEGRTEKGFGNLMEAASLI